MQTPHKIKVKKEARSKISNFEGMEWVWSLLFWFFIILSPVLFLLRNRNHSGSANQLPPGPPGWPVFGYMFKLGKMPHRTLAGLKQKYGPVIWLKLGSTNTMVILTAEAAAELFKNHDLSFAERTITEAMRAQDYHKGSLALSRYGTYWRVLRRICTVEMLVNKRINETVSIRQKCVNDMVSWIEKEIGTMNEEHGIAVARFAFLASFNMVGNLMLSRDLVADPESKLASEFFTAMMGIMEWVAHPNISDVFPCLRWFDLQGLRRKMDCDMGKALKIASGFVKQRIKEQQEGGERRNDFLDVLLDFEGSGKDEPAKLTEHDISIFILEIFLAGSETTSSSVEWALTELLRNPETMIKAKAELDMVVGTQRKFQESDIDDSKYLQAVVKESLRLHPPLPLLLPRKAIQDTNFKGYHIPKNTQVFVNAWAIQRDPECWDDPMSFNPERFLGSKIDYKGQDFELIPFGSGRRMCVGISLGHRMLHLVLGSLLQQFDWELDSRVTTETMDMKEKLGMTARKLEPLYAIPKKRN